MTIQNGHIIDNQLTTMTELRQKVNYMSTDSNKLPYADVVTILLKERNMSAAYLAEQLDMSRSNLSLRLKSNSLTAKTISEISKFFKEDLTGMAMRYRDTGSIAQAAEEITDRIPDKDHFQMSFTDEEMKQFILNSSKSQLELQQEIRILRDMMLTFFQQNAKSTAHVAEAQQSNRKDAKPNKNN